MCWVSQDINVTTSHLHWVSLDIKTLMLVNLSFTDHIWECPEYQYNLEHCPPKSTITQFIIVLTFIDHMLNRILTSVNISKYIITLFRESDFIDCVANESSLQ
jgi:hypothetical protein